MIRVKAFTKEAISRNKKIYDLYHNEYGWVDGWNRGSKLANFHRMLLLPRFAKIPLRGSTCLDVGCGTGDLSAFLWKRGIETYLGVDIYRPSLKKAREKYHEDTFLDADILSGEVRGKFDFVFCSGTLTVNLKTIDNYEFLESMVTKMWQLSREGIVFNVLTTDPHPDPDLFFYNPKRVLYICKRIVRTHKVKMIKNRDKKQAHYYLWR